MYYDYWSSYDYVAEDCRKMVVIILKYSLAILNVDLEVVFSSDLNVSLCFLGETDLTNLHSDKCNLLISSYV
jgi:hypothetical protein